MGHSLKKEIDNGVKYHNNEVLLVDVQQARIDKRAAYKILNNFVFFARQGQNKITLD